MLDTARLGGVSEGVPDRPQRSLLVEFPPPLPAEHRGRVDEHDLPDDRVAGHPDPGQGAGPQHGDRVRCAPGDVLALPDDALPDLFQDREEQRLLAREVVVQRAAADPGLGLDRLDRRAVVPVLGEQPRRNLDHVRPGGPAPLDVLVHPLPGVHTASRCIIRSQFN